MDLNRRVQWYVQITRQEDDIATRIAYAAQELGLEAIVAKHMPFTEPDLSGIPINRPILFHGAISCVEIVQKKNLLYRPFAWFDQDKLACHTYYAKWGNYLLNENYGFYPLGDLFRIKDRLYQTYGADDVIFVRPDTNDKIFVGELVYRERFDYFMNWAYIENEFKNLMAVVAMPVKMYAEWRLFVSKNKVIAGSQYKDGRCLCVDPHYPEDAVKFAEEVADIWSPHPFYCLDIGLTPDGYKVVECGSANCAGFYRAEVRSIVEHMSKIAEEEYYDQLP